jgi:hypothetical protein
VARWLLLLLLLLEIRAVELRVSLSSQGQDLSSLLAVCSTLAEVDYRCDQELAQAYAAKGDALLLLKTAPLTGAHQALAQMLECWWSYGPAGDVRFSRSAQLPLLGEPQTEVLNSVLENERDLVALCENILRPWTGHPDCGLVFHPPVHRWLARLDRDGLRQLRRLLACIENPRVDIPHLPAHPDLPTSPTAIRGFAAAGWPDLLQGLHDQGVSLIASGAALRQPPPPNLRLAACAARDLPEAFRAWGLAAAWIDGVLCIDLREVRRREHPAQKLQITRIPVTQFGDHLEGQALALRLRQSCGGTRWQDPGHALEYLPQHRALLLACEPGLLALVLDQIDRLDREAP